MGVVGDGIVVTGGSVVDMRVVARAWRCDDFVYD